MSHRFLADDFTEEPYWTESLPPFEITGGTPPAAAEVAVIGGGYAGLSAALTLARAGRSVVVLEMRGIGDGAAARAAGSLSHVPKAGLADLAKRYGEPTAREVYREAREAREYVEGLIRDHRIECGLRSGWRFVAAHSPRAFERQRASYATLRETWGEVELVERSAQRAVIGSDAFFGGVKIPRSATLQPAMLQRGLARAAVAAGATLVQHNRVHAVQRTASGFTLTTDTGTVAAKAVILATNGETAVDAPGMARLRRRLLRIPAFALATQPVPAELVRRVLPIGGPVSDTYKIINYIAPDETGTRFILSGRAGRSDGDLRGKATRMFGYFRDRFPDLHDVRVSHCWTGSFAVTADWMPHVGVEDGIHYVLGCCGTGIPMSTYLGHKVAQSIIDRDAAPPVFARPLPSFPLFGAEEALLPIAVRGYALRDRLFR